MNLFSKTDKNKNHSGATISGNRLLASFPEALKPVIWQANLDSINSASYEVELSDNYKKAEDIEEGNNNNNNNKNLDLEKGKKQYDLVIISDGDKEIIASFSDEDKASAALYEIGKALENAPSCSIKSGNTTYNNMGEKSKCGFWGWLFRILATIIGLIILYVLLSFLFFSEAYDPYLSRTLKNNQMKNEMGFASNSSSDAGKPVSADEYLMRR